MTKVVIIILLVILIILSAFFSGSEMVYAKVNQLKLKNEAEDGSKSAKKAYDTAFNFSELISTILIGNNLVNIAASSLATVLCVEIWPKNGALIATISLTVIILIFGEILPKTILPKYNYRLSKMFVPFINFFKIIFFPIVWIVGKIVGLIEKLWMPKEELPTATDEELEAMVDEIEDEGYIDEDTSELLHSAIDFGDTIAYEIMKPRVDLFAFDIEDDIEELINDENIFNYSRVPVYEETIDNIIGFIGTKSILKCMLEGKKINIREMLTEPIYVHKTKPVIEILREFKSTHTHLAVVMDEFGGTLGIITLEDILEELVGEIWDETDIIEEEITQKDEDTYIVDGDMNIYDLFDMLDYEDDEFESEYSTVGGWCTEVLNKFPEVNDSFEYKYFKITILEMDDVRVEKIKIEILPHEEEED